MCVMFATLLHGHLTSSLLVDLCGVNLNLPKHEDTFVCKTLIRVLCQPSPQIEE